MSSICSDSEVVGGTLSQWETTERGTVVGLGGKLSCFAHSSKAGSWRSWPEVFWGVEGQRDQGGGGL